MKITLSCNSSNICYNILRSHLYYKISQPRKLQVEQSVILAALEQQKTLLLQLYHELKLWSWLQCLLERRKKLKLLCQTEEVTSLPIIIPTNYLKFNNCKTHHHHRINAIISIKVLGKVGIWRNTCEYEFWRTILLIIFGAFFNCIVVNKIHRYLLL